MRLATIRRSLLVAVLFAGLLVCSTAVAEDQWSSAVSEWRTQLDEAKSRVEAVSSRVGSSASSALRDALSEAERPKADIERLAGSLRNRAGGLDSARFKSDFTRRDWETAKGYADQLSAQKDAKAAKLQADFNRLYADAKRLNEWNDRLTAWSKRIDEWWARIAPMMRKYTIPDEQAGYDAAVAEKARYDAECKRYNADREARIKETEQWHTWEGQLKAIEKLVVEDGKQVLEARQAASKKEREYVEAKQKYDELERKQAAELVELQKLLRMSMAALQTVISSLDEPAPPVSFAGPAESWSSRETEESAEAVGLTPAVPGGDSGGSVRDRIFVLPPAHGGSGEDAQAEMLRRRLRAEIAAQSIAEQYGQVPVDRVKKATAPPDSTGMVRAPEGFVGPAPVDDGGDSGGAVVDLTDEQLFRPLDPRNLITREEYLTAVAERDRLTALLSKLENVLARLREGRLTTLGAQEELEVVRAETVRGAVRDTLSVIPVSAMLGRLAQDPRLAAKITPDLIRRVDLAMDVLKMEVGREHSRQVRGSEDRRKQELEVMDSAAESLLKIATNELAQDAASRLLLEQMGKMLKVYTKTSRFAEDPKLGERPKWEEIGETVKLGIGIAAVYCPPVALGSGIESLGERGLQRIIIRSAMEDLSASLKSNYDADRFLTEKIDRTRGFLTELDRTVDGYESVSPARRETMHVRGDRP